MKINDRKTITFFAISFLISCAASALMYLGDWFEIRSQIIYIFYMVVGLLSFPWIYLASMISPKALNMFGEVPEFIFRSLIIALGFSINVVLICYVFFVRKWKQQPNLEIRIKLAKKLIRVVAAMTILAGIIIGYILPHFGGHGPSFSMLDVIFMFFGGLVGYSFAYLSVLASKYLEYKDRMTGLYVYVWCVAMMMIGATGLIGVTTASSGSDVALIILSIALIIPGVIGVIVLFTKMAQRTSIIE